MNREMPYRPGRDAARRRAASLAARSAACLLVGLSLVAHAADDPMESADSQEPRELSQALEGQAFKGEMGKAGEAAFIDDVWIFEQGMFASGKCPECGKGEYRVESEDDGTRFSAALSCPDSDVTLVYTGLVKGDRIEGTLTWTQDRWLWDLENKFWFEGERTENAGPATSESDSSSDWCSEMPRRRSDSVERVPSKVRDMFLRFP